ncbi:MAG: histidine phosphatase family protein, partial [Candidatus Aenigmatarchaeota archaeon]
MMELYIARHGETEWNREGRLQGWDDSPLTSLGEKQAEALGERLKELSLYKVYM